MVKLAAQHVEHPVCVRGLLPARVASPADLHVPRERRLFLRLPASIVAAGSRLWQGGFSGSEVYTLPELIELISRI